MWVEFQHQVVRDLAWVIGSPSLLHSDGHHRVSDEWRRISFYDRIPWLRELDKNPEPLHEWLSSRKSKLLGVYFEVLIEYWLSHWKRMKLLAARLPLMGEERAIGEFDFLFRDRFLGMDFHWESAVKFFLAYRSPAYMDNWLGPNPRDTLRRKYDRVFGHQLTLSQRAESLPIFKRLGIEHIQAKAFFKGYLFRHLNEVVGSLPPLPPDISPHYLGGWWCYARERNTIPQREADNRWLSLSRLHWLSPVYNKEKSPGLTRDECMEMLKGHFDGSLKPLLLSEIQPGRDGIWRECARGFVVPDDWPALHRGGGTIPHHE